MHNINYILIIAGILINITLIAGFLFGKKILKSQTSTEYNAKYGIGLVITFVLYLISLITLTIMALIYDLYYFAAVLILFMIVPFIVGYLSTFEKANFFVNVQVMTLIASFFVMTSMIGQVQKPVNTHHLLARHEVLSHFRKNICTLVSPYNQVLKKMVKVKSN